MRNLLWFLILLFPGTNEAQIKKLKSLNYASDTSTVWTFFLNEIEEKPIICLGEESHWIETYLEVKNSFIKALHQGLGYNVIIFESGFVNAFMTQIDRLTAKPRLQESLYTIWQTNSVLNLVRYIDRHRHEMVSMGCDIKGPKSFRFSRFIKRSLQNINDDYSQKISEKDSLFVEERETWEPEIGEAFRGSYLKEEVYWEFKDSYMALLDTIDKYKVQIKAEQQLGDSDFDYFKRSILNRLYLLELMQIPTYQEKHQFRDEKMAENIRWIIQEYMPNKHYIIWAADIHISKNANWEALGEDWKNNRSMVEVLSITPEIGEIFSIGIKPQKRIPRQKRKKWFDKNSNYHFIDLTRHILPGLEALSKEHEALILCKKTESIKSYKIK